ncbi:hypothetical protein MSAN_02209700 [Mycena sanguinolenta]|uniref:Uncharacterized protein n=1 Tax=Mycena sanguinolenta TaxID=230812 RepID=A0A8H6XE53_9AGAR|nr:hypothetical protein MSAN_02209700 [Mycena sanguinolenta]
MNRISALFVRGRKAIRNFVKGSFGRLKLGANTGANTQDLLRTALTALHACSGAYPPLDGAVSALVAILEMSERITHSKKEARELARHSADLLKILAQAISGPGVVSEPMLASITSFESTLTEIQSELAKARLEDRSLFWRFAHLNRTQRTLRNINRRLDDASRKFTIGSAARSEAYVRQVLTLCKKIFVFQGIIVFFCASPVWQRRGAELNIFSASRFTFNHLINMLATDTRARGMSSNVHSPKF